MTIDEMKKRVKDIEGMGLSIADPHSGRFVLYVKVYERLPEFMELLSQHKIPFVVGDVGSDDYRTVWVKEKHAKALYSVNYGMSVDD
jgi:hypothetical protein